MKKIGIMFLSVIMSTGYLAASDLEVVPVEQTPPSSAKLSLKRVLGSIKEIDLVKAAEETITGSGKEKFLQSLAEASKGKDLNAFKKVIAGIKTGFIGGQEIVYSDSGKAGQIVYNLSGALAKVRNNMGKKPSKDEHFQRAIQELHSCYSFGIGIESNDKISKLLSKYLPENE